MNRYLLNILRGLFTAYAFILFVAFLILIFPLVIVASFFGKEKGGNFIYLLCRVWSDFIFVVLGMVHHNIKEGDWDPKQQYVFVFNHISYLDIPVIFKTIRQQHFRVLGKAEMAKIPIFGYLYRSAVVLVNRSDAAHRAKSVMQLKSVLKKGISIVLSPEGTFNMGHEPLKHFYDGAFKIAIETQTPIKPILFLDTYDRMHYRSVFYLSPGRTRSVILETIPVAGLSMDDVDFLKDLVYKKMEEGLIKYKASWIR